MPPPQLASNEALIRVRLAGICATDLEITRGYKGFHGTLGHEFVGEVVQAPDPSLLGCRVCGEINVSCGKCGQCAAGRKTHCERRTVLGISGRPGAFAEYVALPVENLHRVPDRMTDEEAVFVEPVAAAFQIVEQVPIAPHDRVVVLGDGKLGILCAQVLALTGCRLTAVGKHPDKLSILAHRGIDVQRAAEAPLQNVDLVVEATGSADGLECAIEMTRPRGTIVLKTTLAEGAQLNLTGAVVKELTLVGSRCGPFERAIEALEAGRVDVVPLIDSCYPLDRGVEALARAAAPGVLKVLLASS